MTASPESYSRPGRAIVEALRRGRAERDATEGEPLVRMPHLAAIGLLRQQRRTRYTVAQSAFVAAAFWREAVHFAADPMEAGSSGDVVHTPGELLAAEVGDCDDHAVAVGLTIAEGIRIIAERESRRHRAFVRIVTAANPARPEHGHAWAEVWVGDGWVPLDTDPATGGLGRPPVPSWPRVDHIEVTL